MTMDKSKINTPYIPKGNPDAACWEFCREINPSLPDHPYFGMRKVERPRIGSVVLFLIAGSWHSGVVWPDGLHFVHAKPEIGGYVIRQDRLTSPAWSRLIEGFYEPIQ